MERTASTSQVLGASLALFGFGALFLPLRAWLVMVGAGALHGVLPAVPAPGYGTTLLVLLGWGMFRGVKVSATS
ncbi:hypothetical protein ACFC26_07880 [Kitasatospora purpeofusca]|uniref:hypothetical protein n=1 Tax=Kitasatospora purpeofusca TaxID=67352 RepID=UPI0035E043DE